MDLLPVVARCASWPGRATQVCVKAVPPKGLAGELPGDAQRRRGSWATATTPVPWHARGFLKGNAMITGIPPDVSGLPPAARYSELAAQAADPQLASSCRQLAKSMTASHAQLLGFVRAGTGYTLGDGTVVAGTNAQQVNAAVLSAQAASGKGGPCDDPKFRSWLEGRCRELGLNAPDWTGPDAVGNGSSRSSGSLTSDPGGARPPGARIAAYDGRSETAGKSLLCDVKVPAGSTVITPAGERYAVRALRREPTLAGEAFVKAQRYADMAAKAIDPETRRLYQDAASEMRKAAGL